MSKIKLKPLIISLIIPLTVGGLAALITRDNMQIYEDIVSPPLSPPMWLFPVVWTILYILMGISSYIIYEETDETLLSPQMKLYAVQLIVNFVWSILFFNLRAFLISFVWIILLDILIAEMIASFAKVSKAAAKLQIPYLIWVLFASYLNAAIYFLNK